MASHLRSSTPSKGPGSAVVEQTIILNWAAETLSGLLPSAEDRLEVGERVIGEGMDPSSDLEDLAQVE